MRELWHLEDRSWKAEVFVGQAAPALEPYGGKYFPFLLLGIACQDYLTFSQSAFNTSIREHQLMGTLEIIMPSPTPVPLMLLCSSLWGYVFTSVRFVVYLLMLATGLSIASLSALGILTAGLTLLIKRGETVTLLLTGATIVLGGYSTP